MRHKWIVGQVVFVVLAIVAVFMLYPRASIDVEGNSVSFRAINAKVIILSANPDFSNPRYIELEEEKNISFNLKPGVYYWKAGNDIIEGFAGEFKIDSEAGLEIIEKDDNKELRNVGNVKLNVSKTSDGRFVGHIILEPDEGEGIEDKGEYTENSSDCVGDYQGFSNRHPLSRCNLINGSAYIGREDETE